MSSAFLFFRLAYHEANKGETVSKNLKSESF